MLWRLRRSTWLLVVLFVGTLVLYLLVRPAPTTASGTPAVIAPEVSIPPSTVARRPKTTTSVPVTTSPQVTPTPSTASEPTSGASSTTTTLGTSPSSTAGTATTATTP